MDSHSRRVSARSSVNRLLATRERRERIGGLPGLLLGVAASVVGVWTGLDLRSLQPPGLCDGLFVLILAAAAPQPLLAVGYLYHDRLHADLLPWPLSARQHWTLGTRLLFRHQWPWIILLIVAAATAARPLGPAAVTVCAIFVASAGLGAALLAFGLAGLSASIADSDRPTVRDLRQSLAGSFGSERHAPFFYAPALAFGLAALSTTVAQAGTVRWLKELSHATTSGKTLLGAPAASTLVLLPLVIAMAAFFAGRWAYGRHGLRVIPRVHEAARMVYGGRPAPADPPYGLWFSRWMPRAIAPHYCKELREQTRAQRGLWAWLVLAALFAMLYGIQVGSPSRAAPVLALALVIWVCTLPTRRLPRDCGNVFVLTLPLVRSTMWIGRWLALSFVAAHLTIAVAVALAMRHGPQHALLVVLMAIATSLLAVSLTLSRPDQPNRGQWSWTTTAVAPVSFGIGLVGLTWFYASVALLCVAAFAAMLRGLSQ